MRSRVILAAILLTLALMLTATPALAMSGAEVLDFTVGCDEFIVTYDDVLFDRDNTGSNAEAYLLTIIDGSGNVLFSYTDARTLPFTISSTSETLPYDIAPVSNPIRLLLVSNAGNGFEEQTIWDLVGNSPCLPPPTTITPFTGAGIPAGFVMHYITCTTPVYTQAAGVPVGNDRVLEGQTWFVDPEPVEGADGQQWTEIFVGSFINPWIPTACVGGVAPLTP